MTIWTMLTYLVLFSKLTCVYVFGTIVIIIYYYDLIYLCECAYQVKTAMAGWLSPAKLYTYWKRAIWSTGSYAG